MFTGFLLSTLHSVCAMDDRTGMDIMGYSHVPGTHPKRYGGKHAIKVVS